METVTVFAATFVPPDVLALKVRYLLAVEAVKSIAGEMVEDDEVNRFKYPA
jgi:hypothetical protein